MTRSFQAAAASAVLLIAAALGGQAFAQPPAGPLELSDLELDSVAAGGPQANADGLGAAYGQDLAQASSTLATYVQSDQPAGGALGQVAASASSSTGALATASSTLSLLVILP